MDRSKICIAVKSDVGFSFFKLGINTAMYRGSVGRKALLSEHLFGSHCFIEPGVIPVRA